MAAFIRRRPSERCAPGSCRCQRADPPSRRTPTLRLRAPLDHPSGRAHCEAAVHMANSNVVVAKQRVSASAVELRVGGGCRRPVRPREDNNREGRHDTAHAPHCAAGLCREVGAVAIGGRARTVLALGARARAAAAAATAREMHFKSRPTSRS
jgi:hypothetical protein